MKCLVATPHRLGIREVAERVGREWEQFGHDVDYRLARGSAARIGPITVGVPGIAIWWDRLFRELAGGSRRYDLIWTHQPLAPRIPTTDPGFWSRVVVTYHTTLRREYQLARSGVYPLRHTPYYLGVQAVEKRFHRKLTRLDIPPQYTVVSPHLRDELEPYGVESSIYIPNGVFTPDGEFHPIREEYGIPPDATLVFNVGSLTPQKRPVDLARQLTAVCTEDIYCVIAGDGPLAREVERVSGDRVLSVGFVDDEEKWRWFADADVFVSLSAYEGMPVATMEALSFGLPVILSDIPAHRALFETYEVPGTLVSDDPEMIHDAIRTTVGSQADITLPGWDDVALQYLELVDT